MVRQRRDPRDWPEIPDIAPLTRAEELELFRLFRHGATEQVRKQAGDKIILANLRLITTVAKGYLSSGVPRPDIFQYGPEGLILAREKFDPARGTRFITFAIKFIRGKIDRGIHEAMKMIRLHDGVWHARKLLAKAKKSLGIVGDGYDDVEPLAQALGWSHEKVLRILATLRMDPLPIEPRPDKREDRGRRGIYEDEVADTAAASPEDIAAANQRDAEVRAAMQHLSPLEREVITLRYGSEPRSLTEVATAVKHLTGNRVASKQWMKQVEDRAKKKLRVWLA